jgi:hypothetical protein
MLEFFDGPKFSNALCAGAALGMAGLTRSYDAIVLGIPFAIQFLRWGATCYFQFWREFWFWRPERTG